MSPLRFYYFKNAVQNLKKCYSLFINFNMQPKLIYKIHYLYAAEILSSTSLYYFNTLEISELKKSVM